VSSTTNHPCCVDFCDGGGKLGGRRVDGIWEARIRKSGSNDRVFGPHEMKKMRLDNVLGFRGYRIVKENEDPGCSLKERTFTGDRASWKSVVSGVLQRWLRQSPLSGETRRKLDFQRRRQGATSKRSTTGDKFTSNERRLGALG
jgi:hypothetical protein